MSDSATTPQLDQMLASLVEPSVDASAPAAEPEVAVSDDTKTEALKDADPEPEADAPKDEPKSTEKPSFTAEEKNALERARTALRRDGVPVAVIDSLDQDKLLKWGGSRAKAQSDTDDAYRQLSELRKEKETQAAKAVEDPKESATSEPADEPLDLDSLGKTLSESLGDEALAGRVTGVLKSLESRTAKKATELTAKVSEYEQATQRLTEAVLRMEMKGARQELGERFPELRNEADFNRVVEKMQKLAPSGAYESVDDLMAEASLLTFGDAALRRSSDATKTRERRNGLPTAPKGTTAAPSRSKTESAMDFLIELEKKHGVA